MIKDRALPQSELRLAILLLPQFTLSAFALFLDPIRLAADDKDGSRQVRCHWRVMTVNGLPVRSSCGVEVYPTANKQDYADVDWLVVVGGLIHSSVHEDDRVLDMIRHAAKNDVGIIGLCTGVFSMAAAGVLDGERCCVSWFHRDEFVARYDAANVDSSKLFDFGARHVTCAGGIGAVHVALEIIRRSLGESLAHKSASILMVPRFWARNVEQPMSRERDISSQQVRDALRYMEARIEDPPPMPEVARHIGLSVRQLERLFKKNMDQSPRHVMTALRIERARAYLVETDLSMIKIALACGYPSPSHFAFAFKSIFGVPPSAYRQEVLSGRCSAKPNEQLKTVHLHV